MNPSLTVTFEWNRTALHIACANGHAEVVQFLAESKAKLNLCDNQNRSALMKAVQCQHDHCLVPLLEHNADPNLVDINGNTALHLATDIPSMSIAMLLLEHDANINSRNKEGFTPLTISVMGNHVEMAELLLKEGADVNTKDHGLRTPLMMSACSGNISMVRLLLQHNAEITLKDTNGWSSDDYAVMNGNHACSHLIIEHETKRNTIPSTSHNVLRKKKKDCIMGSPSQGVDASFSLGGPATNKDDPEDISQTESISRASKRVDDDWPSSDEDEELDLSPKKPQKLNLKKIIAAKKGKNEVLDGPDRYWSGVESEHDCKDIVPRTSNLPKALLPSKAPKHPIAPSPDSFSKAPQTASIPLLNSRKPSGSKLRVDSPEGSPEREESEEEYEDDQEDSDEDEDDDEDDEGDEEEEDDEDDEDEEEHVRNSDGEDEAKENTVEKESDNALSPFPGTYMKEDQIKDCTTGTFEIEDEYCETTLCTDIHENVGTGVGLLVMARDMNIQENMPKKGSVINKEENSEMLVDCIPVTVDLEDDIVVSAIRVESRISDEDDSVGNQCRLPTESTTFQHDAEEHSEKQFEDFDVGEGDDEKPSVVLTWGEETETFRTMLNEIKVEEDYKGDTVGRPTVLGKHNGVERQQEIEDNIDDTFDAQRDIEITEDNPKLDIGQSSWGTTSDENEECQDICPFPLIDDTIEDTPSEETKSDCMSDNDIPHTDIDGVDVDSSIEEELQKTDVKSLDLKVNKQEKYSSEDDEEQNEDIRENIEYQAEMEENCPIIAAHKLPERQISQDKERDFLSELGLEKGDNEDSWDSEFSSGSPKKQHGVTLNPEIKKETCSALEESQQAVENDDDEHQIDDHDGGDSNGHIPIDKPGEMKKEPLSFCNQFESAKEDADKNTDFMEELGLGEVDDLEGAESSDWDTASTSSKGTGSGRRVQELQEDSASSGRRVQELQEDSTPSGCRVQELQEDSTPSGRRVQELQEDSTPSGRRVQELQEDSTPSGHRVQELQKDSTPSGRRVQELQEDSTPSGRRVQKLQKDSTPSGHRVQELQEDSTPSGHRVQELQEDSTPFPVPLPKDSPSVELSASKLDDNSEKKTNPAETSKDLQPLTLCSFPASGHLLPQPCVREILPTRPDSEDHLPLFELSSGAPERESSPEPEFAGENETVGETSMAFTVTGGLNNPSGPTEMEEQKPETSLPQLEVEQSENGQTQQEQSLQATESVIHPFGSCPKRSPSQGHQRDQSAGETAMAEDFDELTQSTDTASEDIDSPTAGYRHASLLFKQLDPSTLDSINMVKLQNMFHEYERTIQKERNRHGRLTEKLRCMELVKGELHSNLEDIKDYKSALEHQQLELQTDINNLKFQLKQEQQKHRNASMMYDNTKEQLKRKEEQHCLEAEEKQKLELSRRNLELEMRALVNNMKQLEEDHSETQRLLTQERSSRALQENLLTSHLRKQQDIEEENRRNMNKSSEVLSQLTEASGRERELLQQIAILQEDLSCQKTDLELSRSHWQQEESRLTEEIKTLKERFEDNRRDLKLNEEALAQTVFQYNGQLATLKTEHAMVTTRLEHERQIREQLELEVGSGRTRLAGALQEAELCQAARAEAEKALHRKTEEIHRIQDKCTGEVASQRESISGLSQKLSKMEERANSLENEVHRTHLQLAEKSLLLETKQQEKDRSSSRLMELETTLLAERAQTSGVGARREATQERLAQAQSEAMLLRQQLEEAQNRAVAKENAVIDAQKRFSDILAQLRLDCEDRVQLVEERSKELAGNAADLREQVYKLEAEKNSRETELRQLQQELADSLKKLSMSEASLEVNTHYRSDLEEEKGHLLKDIDKLKAKREESEDAYVQMERRINALKISQDDKEQELTTTNQKLKGALSDIAGLNITIKQLEEAVQRLEIENARLEAAGKHQSNTIAALQKAGEEAASVRNRFEDLVTNLQGSKIHLEDQLNQEMQKQSMLSHTAQDSHALWEEELKNRSKLGSRLAQLEKEKEELSRQMEMEKKRAKKTLEQRKSVDLRLDQEMKRNIELQKEMYRLRSLVKTTKKKLKEKDGAGAELASSLSRGEKGGYGHNEAAIGRMKDKVDELQGQLEKEAAHCSQMKRINAQLNERLTAKRGLSRSNERLEKSKKQLEDDVSNLRRQIESGLLDQSQAEQYRQHAEERARKEIQQKLEEVNIFLQTQAASQEALDQIKAKNETSLRSQLEQRIQELEQELVRARSSQHENLSQHNSTRTELERYRDLYNEELRLRKALAAKLERSNERLTETNGKLLNERHRSKSLISSSIANGSMGVPLLEIGTIGSTALGPNNRSLGFGSPLCNPTTEGQGSRVEAYLAKLHSELEINISKELDHATAELEEGYSSRMSPVGSVSGSPKNLRVELDPISRATQQYLDVLKKNYMI